MERANICQWGTPIRPEIGPQNIQHALVDALLWIMYHRGVQFGPHYLDDFLFAGPPGSSVCDTSLATAVSTCEALGVPIAEEKTVGPTTCITFLGIQVDTVRGTLSLPTDKLEHIKSIVCSWRGCKKCSKRELLSLIGQLQHAATVVKPGRTFLRRMIDLSTVVAQLHYTVRLNKAFQADLEWWHVFLETWNGVGILRVLGVSRPDCSVQSDASGKWGCGAVWNQQWFQLQ